MADIVLKITPTTITDLTVKMPDGGAYVTYTLTDVVDMTDWLELEMPCDTDGKVFIESTGYVSQTVTFQSANNPYTIDLIEATDDVANLSDGADSYSIKDKQARFEIDMLKNTKQEKLLEGTGISIGTNGVGQQEIAIDSNVATTNTTQTISGSKTFSSAITTNGDIVFVNNSVTKGTNPSSIKYWGVCKNNDSTNSGTWANTRLGLIEQSLDTTGKNTLAFRVYKNEAGSTAASAITIVYETSTSKAYATAPTPDTTDNSTRIATTAYVRAQIQLVNSLPASPDANVLYCIPES